VCLLVVRVRELLLSVLVGEMKRWWLCLEYKTMVSESCHMKQHMSVVGKICELERELERVGLELKDITGGLGVEIEQTDAVLSLDDHLARSRVRIEDNAVVIVNYRYELPFIGGRESVQAFLEILLANLRRPSLHFADMLFVIMDAVESSNSNYVTSVATSIFVNHQTSLGAILSALIADAQTSSKTNVHYLSNASYLAAWFNAGNEHIAFTLRDVSPESRFASFSLETIRGEATNTAVYLQSRLRDGRIRHHVAFPDQSNAGMSFSNRFYNAYEVDDAGVVTQDIDAATKMANPGADNVLFCFRSIYGMRRGIMPMGLIDGTVINFSRDFTIHAQGGFEDQIVALLSAVFRSDDVYAAPKPRHAHKIVRRINGVSNGIVYLVRRLDDGSIQFRVSIPLFIHPATGPTGPFSEGDEVKGPG